LAAAAAAEQKAANQDDFDHMLSEDEAEEAAAARPSKRRRGPGFAHEEGEGGMGRVAKPKKNATAAKTAATKNAAAYAAAAAAAASAYAPVAGTSAPEATEEPVKSVSGRASAADKMKLLDKEMQTVARAHIQTSGSSTKALESLTVDYFLLADPSDTRYPQSSKLRGVTRLNFNCNCHCN
jgi:hypothetical protein